MDLVSLKAKLSDALDYNDDYKFIDIILRKPGIYNNYMMKIKDYKKNRILNAYFRLYDNAGDRCINNIMNMFYKNVGKARVVNVVNMPKTITETKKKRKGKKKISIEGLQEYQLIKKYFDEDILN